MKYALSLLASAFFASALARPQDTVTETEAVETVTAKPTSVLSSLSSDIADVASEVESVLETPTAPAELSPVQECLDACECASSWLKASPARLSC